MEPNLWVQISIRKMDNQNHTRSMITKVVNSSLLRMTSNATVRGDKARVQPPSKFCHTADLISLRILAIWMVVFSQLRIGRRISKDLELAIQVTWGSTLYQTSITIETLITLAPIMFRACKQTRSSTISGRQTWPYHLLRLLKQLKGLWSLTLRKWRRRMRD